MKTTLTLLCLMVISSISYSQDTKSKESDTTSIFSEHCQMATKQIKSHLNKHIKYPEALISSDIEGTLNLSIHIQPTGKIVKINLLRGLHPLLDQAALAALKDFETLRNIEDKYLGSPQIIVPVTFKLD
jgi:TonB family protein